MREFQESLKPVAIVDLAAIDKNAAAVKKLANGARVIAVVKSDAYGHGMRVAARLEKSVDGFAVSRIEEAMAIRYLGVQKQILVLLPLSAAEIKVASDYRASVTCHNIECAEYLASCDFPIGVHVKIDIGMRRLGFSDPSQLIIALKKLSSNKKVRLEGVYSHFSVASSRLRTDAEYERFLQAAKIFSDFSDGVRHVAASGGLLRGDYNLDAVRVGLLFYGYKPFPHPVSVFPAMKIVAPSVRETHFCAGDECLYGAKTGGGDYSLVEYGYADGLPRNNFPTRCMDLSYVKSEGGYAVVLDDAEKFAEQIGTISYEVLVGAARRLKKIYIG